MKKIIILISLAVYSQIQLNANIQDWNTFQQDWSTFSKLFTYPYKKDLKTLDKILTKYPDDLDLFNRIGALPTLYFAAIGLIDLDTVKMLIEKGKFDPNIQMSLMSNSTPSSLLTILIEKSTEFEGNDKNKVEAIINYLKEHGAK